jgi:hypothetical protein
MCPTGVSHASPSTSTPLDLDVEEDRQQERDIEMIMTLRGLAECLMGKRAVVPDSALRAYSPSPLCCEITSILSRAMY